MNGKWERNYLTGLKLFAETAAVLLGLYIMFKATSMGHQEPWLYAAAIAMMGLPVANRFENWVGLLETVLRAVRDTLRAERERGRADEREEH
jgi:hypothetical protein